MNAVAVNNRGATYLIMGDIEHALAYFSEAIRLNPNYALAFNNRGMAWRDKGDLAHAVVDFGEAIKINPRGLGAIVNRANAHRDLGERRPLGRLPRRIGVARLFDAPIAWSRQQQMLGFAH
jgi:tetratricopeptide (TPR) repeat protein